MQDRRHRLGSLALTVTLLALNLIALNWLLSGWTRARVDMTEEGLFSISPATRRILGSLDEDLTIYGYFSRRTHPKLAPLVPRIVDLLDEYRAVSGGKLHVEIIDPGEDEDAAQEAADRFGVRSTPFRMASKYEAGIVNAYFALVIRYGDQYERYEFGDLIDVEPMPDGDIEVRLRNLEYDLTRAIKKVVYGFQGSAELFSRVDTPVTFTAVMSPDTLPEVFSGVPDAVRKAADALSETAGDKFVFHEIDPTKDPDGKAQVTSQWGLSPMSLGLFGDTSFWLYGVVDVGGHLEQLRLTGEDVSAAAIREAIESSIKRYTPGFLKTVGIVAPSPPDIPPQLRMQMGMPQQPPPEFDEVKSFLGQDYAVKDVSLDDDAGVPADVDVLLVLKPTNLPDKAVYHLDQYLMRGGRVVLCAGAYDADFSANGLQVTPLKTGLEDWLGHLGLTVQPTLVLDDRNQPLPIPEVRNTPLGTMRTWRMEPYPYLVQVQEDGFLDRNVTASLDSVGIYWGSPIAVDESKLGDDEQVLPILQSSPVSWTSDDLDEVNYVDYTVPSEDVGPQRLAVALTGRFPSFYGGDRPAPGASSKVATSDGGDDTSPPASTSVPLERSPETRLVLVGNAEFLSDFVARSLGQVDAGFFGENLRFIENVIDWSTLDNDMIAIRSRGMVSRRLERTERGTEVAVEAVNYAIPVALIALAALWVTWRRRTTPPMFAPPTAGRAGATEAPR